VSHLFNITTHRISDFIGLFIIALSTGAIKPCISPFAADQFDANTQKEQRRQFFSFFLFSIEVGALLAALVMPMLRAHVKCFGSDQCFPLAFGEYYYCVFANDLYLGVPAILMLFALIIFLSGTRIYKKQPPSGNNLVFKVFIHIFACNIRRFLNAIGIKLSSRIGDYSLKKRRGNLSISINQQQEKLISDSANSLSSIISVLALPFTVSITLGSLTVV
jgi:dipeptide/tripeptide permease